MGSYAPKTVEGEIVSLYIDHGREDNADYQYLILPASTAEKTAAFAVQDIRVIRNDTSIQAVAAGNCFYVTAYEPQVVNLQKDLQVDLQTPGIYMFRLHNGNWLIEAADPTHKQHSLSLKMNGKDVKIVFPPVMNREKAFLPNRLSVLLFPKESKWMVNKTTGKTSRL